MCPNMEATAKPPTVYRGVIDGSEKEFNVENVKQKWVNIVT